MCVQEVGKTFVIDMVVTGGKSLLLLLLLCSPTISLMFTIFLGWIFDYVTVVLSQPLR